MLTSREKYILKVFSELMKEVKCTYLYKIGKSCVGDNRYTFYKEGNKWVAFDDLSAEACHFSYYSNIYNLCIDFFQIFIPEKSEYCIEKFSSLLNCKIEPSKMEVMSLINDACNTEFLSDLIENLRTKQFSSGKVTAASEFDKYEVGQFFILYKIDKLLS